MEGQEATAVQCRHHWVIEAPDGPVSRGVCKICGAEKRFTNTVEDTVWENETFADVFGGYWSKSRRRAFADAGEEEYLKRAS